MALITLNIDENIYDDVVNMLKEFPENKIQINEEAIIIDSINEIDLDLADMDDDEDYFMYDEENDIIMNFKVYINEVEEYDEIREVQVIFDNGRRFIAYYTLTDDVMNIIEEEDYYFSRYVIVKEINETIIRNSVESLILNIEFYDAFDDISDYNGEISDFENIDPVRKN